MTADEKAGRSGKARKPAAAGPQNQEKSAPEAEDTEGQMFLPDRSNEYLARAREQEIRQHLSRRGAAEESRKQKRK